MLRAPRQQWKEPPEELLLPTPPSQRPPWMRRRGLRCGSALSQPEPTPIAPVWPGAKNQEDGDTVRELAAAFAFSFWQLAPIAGEAGAARICLAAPNAECQQKWESIAKIRLGKEEKGEGGGIASPAPFTLLEGTRATKGIHGEKIA